MNTATVERGIKNASKNGMATVLAGMMSHDKHGCNEKIRGAVRMAQKNVEKKWLFHLAPRAATEELMVRATLATQES